MWHLLVYIIYVTNKYAKSNKNQINSLSLKNTDIEENPPQYYV